MKLLELYSLASGLKINDQFLVESFYPVDAERYITFQASSGMVAKNYPFYNEVITLLREFLSKSGIKTVQLGSKEDAPLLDAIHLQGKTNIHQSNYVLKRSLLHIGNDSWLAHRAGALNVPLVSVYGSTTEANHAPFDYDRDKSIFIESHRFGRKATFSSQESPSTIALIPPEQIAHAALSLLGADSKPYRRSLYFGDLYNHAYVELVPNTVVNPQTQIPNALILRMDYEFNEQIMAQNLQLRKCTILTDREIDLGILAQFKGNITSLRLEIDKISPKWISQVKRLGVPIGCFAAEKDEVKLRQMRLDYFSACFFDLFTVSTVEDFKKASAIYLNKELDIDPKAGSLKFKTNKFLLSDNKIYLSKAHWKAGKHTENTAANSGDVIDSLDFYQDQAHYYIYQ